jgi:hypothetical protein
MDLRADKLCPGCLAAHRRLNVEMFGDFESYEGEGADDKDFAPRAPRRRPAASSP